MSLYQNVPAVGVFATGTFCKKTSDLDEASPAEVDYYRRLVYPAPMEV